MIRNCACESTLLTTGLLEWSYEQRGETNQDAFSHSKNDATKLLAPVRQDQDELVV